MNKSQLLEMFSELKDCENIMRAIIWHDKNEQEQFAIYKQILIKKTPGL